MNVTCNMEKNERRAYYVIGAVLIVGALLGFSKFFAILLGLGLIVEAYLGWCCIPYLMNKFSKNQSGPGPGTGTP